MVGSHWPSSLSDVCSTTAWKETPVCGNKRRLPHSAGLSLYHSYASNELIKVYFRWLWVAKDEKTIVNSSDNSQQRGLTGSKRCSSVQFHPSAAITVPRCWVKHVGLCVYHRGHWNRAKTSPGTVMKPDFFWTYARLWWGQRCYPVQCLEGICLVGEDPGLRGHVQ